MSPDSNLNNSALSNKDGELCLKKPTISAPWNYDISYKGIFCVCFVHLSGIYGLYIAITSTTYTTLIFNVFTYIATGLGVTAGAHRLWSHRSYKAKLPLQILLMLFQSMALQYTVINWVKEHRLHHKHSDTDADPHNASRGFFFSHFGWLFVDAHDEVKKRLELTDISDVTSNPVLRFQKKYAYPVIGAMCFILPTIIPIVLWQESFNNAWHMNMLRLMLSLNATFLINSAAHMYGNKPYEINISPTQNSLVSVAICGEGFHNYHHVFPWDYRAGELGNNVLNLSARFIDLCAAIGWAYDLKTASEDMVRARARKTGDGTDSWGQITMNTTK